VGLPNLMDQLLQCHLVDLESRLVPFRLADQLHLSHQQNQMGLECPVDPAIRLDLVGLLRLLRLYLLLAPLDLADLLNQFRHLHRQRQEYIGQPPHYKKVLRHLVEKLLKQEYFEYQRRSESKVIPINPQNKQMFL
jgi:hypothetical protein